jgi:hypothetical protein
VIAYSDYTGLLHHILLVDALADGVPHTGNRPPLVSQPFTRVDRNTFNIERIAELNRGLEQAALGARSVSGGKMYHLADFCVPLQTTKDRQDAKRGSDINASELRGAGDRDRTGTGLLSPRDFKSLASAYSATPARGGL